MSDITLLEEISEQDLHQVNGGTFTVTAVVYVAGSIYKGNKGAFCTISRECSCDS
ncbi:plantaricin C family lantibiotic [Rothia dentocariosa]|uniref:plantaricin C family lantibiotic n=1 Tax=Rothia dentocariosa TaxID=2047 RepID=UPI000C7E57BE|nr:hypothetical protein CYK04_09760 [Rothia dentocariosa]